MIDRANTNDTHPARIPSTSPSVPSVHPWSTPDRVVDRPVVQDGPPRITRAAARVHEGMPALSSWSSSEEAANHVAHPPSPALRECLVGLREAVEGYVGQRRVEGAPVERVLAEVKALVRRAEGCDLSREATDAIMPQVVRWGIQTFYHGDAPHADARRDP